MAKVTDFEALRIRIASPEEILSWSHGEVTKPETINYRTQRPERDGLFCERIFGPEKDWECYCGKYKRIRYKGIICDKCGVEVTRSIVRRERMGHIKLITPVAHIWFFRGVPSKLGLFLNIPVQQLERVIYYASYIVSRVDNELRETAIGEIEKEYRVKVREADTKARKNELAVRKSREIERLRSLRKLQVFSEVEYHDLSLKYGEVFEAGTGSEALVKIIKEMDLIKLEKDLILEVKEVPPVHLRKVLRRLKLVHDFVKKDIKPEWMFLAILPVIPPDLRPMVQLDGGRFATSDLNDLYRRVINRNNRLKHLEELNAPEVIKRNEKRMLQEAVDSLIDNSARRGQAVAASTGGKRLLKSLADMLKGKQGRFRQNLLGKRVDYSGRSVIVIGPNLKLDECGIPKTMALELFKPFVIHKIIERELAYNIRGASRLIEEAPDEVWEILEEVIEGKYVLLNRAPTLHRLGVQAFRPRLIEGQAIQIHPMVCAAFNADFDGDQMAVHLPLSENAQKEAREIMLSRLNLLKPATGRPIVLPSKDIVLGCFWLTRIKDDEGPKKEKVFANFNDVRIAYEFSDITLHTKIKVRNEKVTPDHPSKWLETSYGRIIFNESLPDDFPFFNEEANARNLERLVSTFLDRYDYQQVTNVLDEIKKLGFEYSTRSGITWGMNDLKVPAEKKKLIENAEKEVEMIQDQYLHGLLSYEERKTKIIQVWFRVMQEVAKAVPTTLDKWGPVYTIVASGARGSWNQPTQMMGMKGLLSNPSGEIIELPVKSSYKEGFNVLEYFISTHGARKGTADTALRTATAGYLTRRLVDVSQDMVVSIEDCGDENGFSLFRKDAEESGESFAFKLFGRVLAQDIELSDGKKIGAGTVLDQGLAEIAAGSQKDPITVRSPLSCNAIRGICRFCYGYDLGRNELIRLGEAIGVVAAQAIGEPGTQLTMRTFHTGGVASESDITQGLPRAQEIFEARPPKGKAMISDFRGEVMRVREEEGEIRVTIKGKRVRKGARQETKEYIIPPGSTVLCKKGDHVEPGDRITKGSVDLKELFKVTDYETVARHIINQIQVIYTSQGALIHDKHIEVIVRQMFSRVRIRDAGSSDLSPGEMLARSQYLEVRNMIKGNGGTPPKAQRILLGISKAALMSESFLSAASFQETARVLINAATEGKIDRLRGLKENVIIGRLIPAGTGFRRQS